MMHLIFEVCMWSAVICTTLFPIVYYRTPWYSTHLGQALMGSRIALAAAVNIAMVIHYWQPEQEWVRQGMLAGAFGAIGLSSAVLLAYMVNLNWGRDQ